MKKYEHRSNLNINKLNNKSKHHANCSFLSLLLALCLCSILFIIGIMANNFMFAVDKQSNPHFFDSDLINADANIALVTDDAQNDVEDIAWRLILVNKWNYIPSDYEVQLAQLSNGQFVDKRIYNSLKEMLDAAKMDGVYPVVVSGYRTAQEQQSLMDKKIGDYKVEGYSAEEAVIKAQAWVAVPGTSEHQLGIAVDINADGIRSTGEEVYEWLGQNSYRFGFIRRYQAGKTEITGVIDEPWHYRYVGVDEATEIFNQDISLEEYLSKIN